VAQPKVHVHLIMPRHDHERIQQEAERSSRGVSGEIVHRLRQSLAEPNRRQRPAPVALRSEISSHEPPRYRPCS